MLPPPLQQSIENIAVREGYKSYVIDSKTLSTDGGNFMGQLFEVNIKGKTAEGDKETNLFVKNMINDDKMKGHFALVDAYVAESYVYNELSKIYTELQTSANISAEDRLHMVRGYEESNNEAIYLENAAKAGFKTYNRMDIVSNSFARLSVEQLAKFHALSFVLQNRRPEYFDKNIKPIKIPFFWNEESKAMTLSLMNITLSNIQDGETKKKAEQFIPVALEKYPKFLHNNESKIRCLCHGDFKATNILIKESNGKISEVVPVDYQLLHYGCPVSDLIYFLFFGTDRQFRKQHLHQLKDLYYDTFVGFLQRFGLNGAQLFPREVFEAVFKENLDYGLIIAMVYFPLDFNKEIDVDDFSADNVQDWKATLDVKFQDRFKGVIDDFVEWGYL